MAKGNGKESTYVIIEVVGTSKKSWEDAAMSAVKSASRSLKDLRVAEVIQTDLKIEKGKATAFRTRLNLSFKYHGQG